MEQQRKAVVVLGMHRSGTSAMARVLSLAGAQLPTRLSGPYIGNPLGHWEPLDVADFNDKVLSDLDTSWSDPLGPRQGRTKKSLPLKRYVLGAQEVIRKNYDSDFIVFKEPRSILLLDLWRDALKSEGYELSYVVMVRHPNEVAQSLANRDKFIKNRSLILWSTYMLASELGTRGYKRVFVKFDELIQDPESTLDRIENTLGLEFDRRTWGSALDIEQFVSREERHHWNGDRSTGLEKFPEIDEFYSYLNAAARDEPWNIDVSTRMAEWLNGLASSVGPIFKQFERQLRQSEADLAAERETAGQIRQAHEQTLAEQAGLQAEFERQLRKDEADLLAEREKAAQARQAHEEALAKLVDSEAELAEIRAEFECQLKENEAALAEEQEAAVEARRAQEQTLAELAEIRAEFERQLRENEATLAEAQEAAAEARRAQEQTLAELAETQAELEMRLKENESALADIADMQAEFERQLGLKEAALAVEQEAAAEARRAHEQAVAELTYLQARFARQSTQNEAALAAQRETISHLGLVQEQAEVQLAELRAELDQARMEAGNGWQRATELEAGLAFAREQIEEKERNLDQRAAELQRARNAISEAERQSMEARANAAARDSELQNAVHGAYAEVDAYRKQSEALASELIKVIGARREAPWRRFRIPFMGPAPLPRRN